MRTLPFLALAAALATSGCASLTRTPYERPSAPLPAIYAQGQVDDRPIARDDRWWREFRDPSLDALIDLAIARNPDLAAAAVRVRRATLQAQLTGNALFPIASGSADTGFSRGLSGAARSTRENASAMLGVTWQVDLFGRLANERDAAAFETLATAQDRDAAFLTLIGTTASLYWQIALANERIALGEQSLAYARRAQALVDAQYRAGAVSALEQREIEQTVTTQVAALSQLRQTRVEARQTLMVVLDGVQSPVSERQSLGTEPLPAVAAGLPADLLRRRPDLRASELRLRRTLASGDATRASYYPAVSLTGGLGTSSTSLLDLIANPVATLGAGLTLPFLNVRAMRFDRAIARTQYEEAVILFRKSLYTALSEVENALSARQELAAQTDVLGQAQDAARAAERLYEVRYRSGAVPLRTWLDAQERRRSAELALSANRFARLQNQMSLHQVLGGGFAE